MVVCAGAKQPQHRSVLTLDPIEGIAAQKVPDAELAKNPRFDHTTRIRRRNRSDGIAQADGECHGQSWCAVELKVGDNEIGDADEAEMIPLADDIAEVFARVGLPKPSPLPLMPIEYQIAHKLHGMTSPKANRPYDLTDIQVIVANSKISEIGNSQRVKGWLSLVE